MQAGNALQLHMLFKLMLAASPKLATVVEQKVTPLASENLVHVPSLHNHAKLHADTLFES